MTGFPEENTKCIYFLQYHFSLLVLFRGMSKPKRKRTHLAIGTEPCGLPPWIPTNLPVHCHCTWQIKTMLTWIPPSAPEPECIYKSLFVCVTFKGFCKFFGLCFLVYITFRLSMFHHLTRSLRLSREGVPAPGRIFWCCHCWTSSSSCDPANRGCKTVVEPFDHQKPMLFYVSVEQTSFHSILVVLCKGLWDDKDW